MTSPQHPDPLPVVIVTGTASVDGRIALGRDRRLLEPAESERWRALHPPGEAALAAARAARIDERHAPTATLAGSGSFVPDDAGAADLPPPDDDAPDALLADFLPASVVHDPERRAWYVVADSRGRVRWSFAGADGTHLLVLVARATPPAYLAFLRREGIPYLLAGGERVDPRTALERLRDALGVRAIVADGGGELTASLLRDGLVDELELLVLPALIGGHDTPALVSGPTVTAADAPTRLRLRGVRSSDDGALWTSWTVEPIRHPPGGRA